MNWFVYILNCSDGSYYIGHTGDLDLRLQTHNSGLGATHTAARLPVTLIYSEYHSIKQSAVQRERQLKGWSRAKKQALINGEMKFLKRLLKK